MSSLVTDIDISGYSPAYFVPADGQYADPLGGPAYFEPVHRRRPRAIDTFGVEPRSYLRRQLLWVPFGLPNVRAVGWDGLGEGEADALVIDAVDQPPTWAQLLEAVGERSAVVDVAAAAAMGQAGGDELSLTRVAGSREGAITVFGQKRENEVYPDAPAVDVVADPPMASGFAAGDRFHLYGPIEEDGRAIGESEGLVLRALANDAALGRFAERFGATVWGRAGEAEAAALMTCPTPGGGQVTVMDLRAVDRPGEPSNAEALGVQLLLSLIGCSQVTFGRFLTAYPTYEQYVQVVSDLAQRYSRFASLEHIGHSTHGRDMWMLKIAPDPTRPVVLNTVSIHPYEWAANYGLLRYVRYLLEGLEGGGFVAKELLDGYQFWWVLSACPDGFEVRGQHKNLINLNRNFPGVWERAPEHHPVTGGRGPAPASQPETRTLMALLERTDGRIAALADFHEAVSFNSFLHQFELDDGTIPDLRYHVELLEGCDRSFNDRFWIERDGRFLAVPELADFHPGQQTAWMGYCIERGVRGSVIEASGGDCTHYQTPRRIEYDVQVADQILAGQNGRLYRNRWGDDQAVTLNLARRPGRVECRLYDREGRCVGSSEERKVTQLTRDVPGGGCMRLRYHDEALR